VTSPVRPLRADAARNRALLLVAAEQEFLERGPDASVADIARRAGIAKGTVFRHFASKEELIAAIVAGHLAALTVVARSLAESSDPGVALLEFMTVAADTRQQHDLSFLQTASEGHPKVTEIRDELYATIETLVDRAREAGAVRSDISGLDVIVLLCAPVHVVGYVSNPAPDLWRRYLAIIFDGLRPEGATALPRPGPSGP
jgi:AcrR family transcriptional regulator